MNADPGQAWYAFTHPYAYAAACGVTAMPHPIQCRVRVHPDGNGAQEPAVNRHEPSKVIYVRMIRENDPYAVPLTSLGRHNQLAAGYANKSLRTLLKAPKRGIL
jgi:hypothetical protein